MQPNKTIDEQQEERPFPVKRLKTAATNTRRFKTLLATTRKLPINPEEQRPSIASQYEL